MLFDLDFLNDVGNLIVLFSLIISAGGTLAAAFTAGKALKADLSVKSMWQNACSDPKPSRLFTGGMDQILIWISRIMKMASAPDDDGDRRPFSYTQQAKQYEEGIYAKPNISVHIP
ncbi:hypothetical protein GKZ89_10125 [Bacillus mangrovi]|uniref:Uncharacterized protein n=1 Tax=Metabacillus mangrovi TaxID=1491830 RepID=A0A7X2V528_9BACI|nr:hypothetical protein [Metabacillus mangrovi]MTH53761.1 hypothetical protein [Metabacillus mangrovi]